MTSGRLRARDVLAVGALGLHSRRLRAGLSAIGVAIGIASMVAVLGVSASSQADLLRTIDRLGTNMLTVTPGRSFFGDDATLPSTARDRIVSVSGVERAASVYAAPGATVRRSAFVDRGDTNGIAVSATETGLPATLHLELASGKFLDPSTERFPTVVLGQVAAQRLGIGSAAGTPQVVIGDQRFTVIGVLRPAILDSAIDRSALIGLPAAVRWFGATSNPTKTYVRVEDGRVNEVRDLLGATANPERPEEVDVSRPSDALEARAAAQSTFTSLFLGLGAVALLVGGVGIANVMVISVLERRSEIGLRRALGATRRHITLQFLTESLLLAAAGGVAGAVLGTLATGLSSAAQDQPLVVPPAALVGSVAAALLIGGIAGLYPSIRAARLQPTEALRAV